MRSELQTALQYIKRDIVFGAEPLSQCDQTWKNTHPYARSYQAKSSQATANHSEMKEAGVMEYLL
ncbi:hypothetical protein DPMN_160459 [Dreissena polymorpha]|uniref:Uncharacterized protein n=1 Tax=Dreissena polymorpha TaxID=45954 RepID=A0A9D4IRQ2_DREPO|nr:hypothetical protein DPMN_160459 [Dreissena polymorpha]